jgi:hypothetical protein
MRSTRLQRQSSRREIWFRLGTKIVRPYPLVEYRIARHQTAATEAGARYVHSANEPHLISGVGTATLEILAEQPGTEVIVVPVGGGSGAAGASAVARAVRPSIKVIGVQAAAAPAAHRSWQAGQLVEAEMGTFAEGLATRTAFELPQQIMRALLRDFVLVSEEQLRRATRVMIEKTRSLVEPAGAAALAAVLAEPARFAGRKVAIMCSGGNISPAQLTALWSDAGPEAGPPGPPPAQAHHQDWRIFVCQGVVVASMIRHGASWITNIKQGARAKAAIASQELIDLAVRSTSCIGADYAGVDIIQAQDGGFLVLEVNSMPAWNGLQAVSRQNIADHLVGAFLDAALAETRRKGQEGA